jgi:signal transduction histidine kinase
MKDFFKSVRQHIGKLDAGRLREQYNLIADEAEFFDLILRTLDRGIIVIDDERGEVKFANDAVKTLIGMEPAQAIEVLALPLGKASRREMTVTYPESRTLEVQTFPMKSRTLALIRDTTAEKARSEEELRSGATRAVRDLAAGVAHEIGNPLNAIALNLQLLQRQLKGDETVEECLHQVARLDGIIRGFLAALRPAKPNLMPGSIAEPLTACIKTLKRQFEDRRISVTLDIPGALPSVALDRNQMEQVFFNLLKNALEAMKDGGCISIAVDCDDNDVSVTVRDSGAGMSPEQLAHLFEPYRTTKSGGSGLGLMVTSRIVHDHGGTIAAESTPGEGSTFTVRLPRIERRIRELK